MRNSLIDILKRRGFQFGVYEIENKNSRIQLNGFSQFYKWIREVGTKNPKQMNKIKDFIIAGTGNSRVEPFLNQ
ncbi:MAG: hypothetical protein QXO57_00885 [Candidatus Aenigmatarchaeota archaeon]|nr:hypothetical protein [Candidatus Aenigmarchaeota archaeon]